MILIAGGGTGGHIYPAIAIAQAIQEINPSCPVAFVGTHQGLEKKIIPREGYKLYFIKAAALNNVGMLAKLLSLLLLPVGILQSIFLILKLKPKVVLGVGGYASGPMMLAAVLMCKKTAVFEPNAHPGLTNRKLARFVNIAFVNFEVTKKFFKNALLFGMPVRKSVEEQLLSKVQKDFSVSAAETSQIQANTKSKINLLVFGGSQGARGINKTILEAVKTDPSWLKDFNVVHQIGATDWAYFDDEYKKFFEQNDYLNAPTPSFQWFEFLYDMPERYQWADFVLCRAGAATISELAAIGKAAILVPFPYAADNHQQKNAEALFEKNAADLILQKDFDAKRFISEIYKLKNNPNRIYEFEKSIKQFHKTGAAQKTAERLLVT